MNKYTDGRTSSTLVISSQLLLLLPRKTHLTACLVIKELIFRETKKCELYNVDLPEKCDSCHLNAPDKIDAFREVCVDCDCTSYQNDTFEFYSKRKH